MKNAIFYRPSLEIKDTKLASQGTNHKVLTHQLLAPRSRGQKPPSRVARDPFTPTSKQISWVRQVAEDPFPFPLRKGLKFKSLNPV